MIYILLEKYIPGTAPTNRILSYARGLSEQKIATTLVFIFPDNACSKFDMKLPYVSVVYFWNSLSRNKYLKWIYAKIRLSCFIKMLKKGDSVYLYNNSELIPFFTKLEGVKVYHERTEHVDVHASLSSRFNHISKEEYIEACKSLNGLFVISTSLKHYFIERGIPSNIIHIINIIVDSTRFEGILKSENIDNYIAYCGTASNNKDGVNDLIKAFAIFSKTHRDFKLYIIGEVPSRDDEAQNLQLIDTLGITDKVIFTGKVDASRMPQLLKDARVLALDRPNNLQAQNGFPTKLGEYLMTKNPVVITSVGDIPLFLEDGISAYMSEPENDLDFSNKLSMAVDNFEEARRIGESGYMVAIKNFSHNAVSQLITNVIFEQ